MAIQAGDKAPDFTLPNQEGKPVALADVLRKGTVVLYFYPKDDTPGCTIEACAFRDSYEDFRDAGAEVVGISSQSAASHQAFVSKNRLPFILVSDEGGEVRKRYGVPKTLGLLPGRVTYIIDSSGTVRHVFNSLLSFKGHAREALEVIARIRAEAPKQSPSAQV